MINQLGGGRGGQAIVDNYLRRDVGLEEVQNGNITVVHLYRISLQSRLGGQLACWFTHGHWFRSF